MRDRTGLNQHRGRGYYVRFTPESDAECAHSNVRLEARRSTEWSVRPHPSLQDQGRQYLERSTSTLPVANSTAALVPAFAHLGTTSQRIAALHYLRMAEGWSSTGRQKVAAGKSRVSAAWCRL